MRICWVFLYIQEIIQHIDAKYTINKKRQHRIIQTQTSGMIPLIDPAGAQKIEEYDVLYHSPR